MTQHQAQGYKVDNLGLPVWLVEKLKADYPDKSIHYAIQQVLKSVYKK